ncbi:MAG: M23 family metallopeptidase [Clostridia bacterium]|nr:M23 family metallopeptidase [Clostridia bacterium]
MNKTENQNMPKNSILKIVAIVAAIFLPTIIGIISYIAAQNVSVNAGNITKLEITDADGNQFTLMANDSEDMKDINGFVSINDNAESRSSLPSEIVSDSGLFEFKYYNYDRVQVYKYYFSSDTNNAYFVDSRDNCYQIVSEDAASFLSTKYARCLYDTTAFPTMTISEETLLPVEAKWEYQTYGGAYVALDGIETSAKSDRVYEMKGAFALSFDNQPDDIRVTVTADGSTLYTGVYEEIVNTSLEGRTIDVHVEADWYENPAFSGKATYDFKAKILVPAAFYLGRTEVEPGEFVVISARNVDDPSAIKFTSDPDIGYTPVFFQDGIYARALVPINMNFDGTEVHITCTYGEVSQPMTLNIKKKTFGSSSIAVTPTVVSQTRTETTMNTFKEAMAPIIAETEATPLWEGTFHEGTAGGNVRIGFGRYVTITGTSETFRHEGCDYIVKYGEDIMAMNNGKVVFAGYLDYSGYMVVIDHGLGLKSWYAHLNDNIPVQVGDTVAKGDVIGHGGTTGFTSLDPICHIAVSVYDVPVSQYDLWDNGVQMEQ